MSTPNTDNREHLVVIGNGMAGCRAVEEILARDLDRFDITIFGAEPRVNYNRIMLSPVLAGEKSFDEIVINGPEWYSDKEITLITGDTVVSINRSRRKLVARYGLVARLNLRLLVHDSDPFI